MLPCNEAIRFLEQLSGEGGSLIQAAWHALILQLLAQLDGLAVIDGRMCFPSDNVS